MTKSASTSDSEIRIDGSRRSGIVRLYHGTNEESARLLLRDGFDPATAPPPGSQCGRHGLLYVTNSAENAAWYAEQAAEATNGRAAIIAIDIVVASNPDGNPAGTPVDEAWPDWLVVDPDDGVADSVTEELSLPHGLPGSLAIAGRISPGDIVPIMGVDLEIFTNRESLQRERWSSGVPVPESLTP